MTKSFFSVLFLLIAMTVGSFGQQNQNLNSQNLAIEGYDPVSYFNANKAIKGVSKNTYQYEGATYQFATTQNLAAFKLNPNKYAPQYGGWCAYAMGATGEKVDIDPSTFKIVGGKLYLFYNKYFNNTLTSWNKDEKSLKIKADKNWAKIK